MISKRAVNEHILPQAVLLLAMFALSGCSTFHREWREAAKSPPPAHGIEGRWQGTWRSEVSGHSGRLRCLMTQAGDERHIARFHAKYMKLLSFGYTLTLRVQTPGTLHAFVGEANLPKWAGGDYSYTGHAASTNFFSTYRCKRDHGVLEMTRPP